MQEMVTAAPTGDNLWVLAKVKDSVCAVDSSCVESILLLEDDVTALPDSDDVHTGIINLRGNIVPITDLRRVLGLPAYKQEQLEFEQMLEQRKQDHIRWVTELKRCLETKEDFGLATDPHKCAFGRWYDSYKPTNNSVAFHLGKIDEPHKKLHATADEVFSLNHDCEHCTREECVKKALAKATDSYMPRVLELLEEAKKVFAESYRRMVVVLYSEGVHCGLLVDEVLSAEPLPTMTENTLLGTNTSQSLVTHIAKRRDGDSQVLVLSTERLLHS